MDEYTIYPIKVGEFKGMEKSTMTYREDFGEKLTGVPILIFLIKGAGRTILMDTGPSDMEWVSRYRIDIIVRPEKHPIAALKKHGVDAGDIETVVLTHLHWDHCYNTECFPNALFYVQKRELEYAVDPFPEH